MTDPLQISANGLPTVRTCDLMDFLKDYCSHESVERIIVGLPKTLKGEDSESSRYIEPFLKRLTKDIPHIPVDRFDERFTSTIAHRAMIEGGVKKSDRMKKELADKVSAVLILTGWLDARKIQ